MIYEIHRMRFRMAILAGAAIFGLAVFGAESKGAKKEPPIGAFFEPRKARKRRSAAQKWLWE